MSSTLDPTAQAHDQTQDLEQDRLADAIIAPQDRTVFATDSTPMEFPSPPQPPMEHPGPTEPPGEPPMEHPGPPETPGDEPPMEHPGPGERPAEEPDATPMEFPGP